MKVKFKTTLTGYLFILPLTVLFSVFIIYPIFYNVYLSFFDWNGISETKQFVGWHNYEVLFSDPVLSKILFNFVIFAVFTITIEAFLGLVFASILIRKIRFSSVYKTLIYLPIIATPSIVGNIFSKILESNRGYLNEALRALHLEVLCHNWLSEPKMALMWVIIVNIWQWTGYSMMMYYANMLNIPGDMYEAAQIDGASGIDQFRKITLPLLRGTHFTVVIMGVIGSLKTFDIPYVLTGGGPNHATEFFSTYIYTKSFYEYNQGLASTVVVAMMIIALTITAVQLVLYYRNDKDKELAG